MRLNPLNLVSDARGFGAWAGALVVVLAFALVAKTSTVGAPIEAHTMDRGPAAAAVDRPGLVDSLERPTFFGQPIEASVADVRPRLAGASRLESEVVALRSQLAFERRRCALLARSVDTLSARVDELADSVAPTETDPLTDPERLLAPIPVDAIYVRSTER